MFIKKNGADTHESVAGGKASFIFWILFCVVCFLKNIMYSACATIVMKKDETLCENIAGKERMVIK